MQVAYATHIGNVRTINEDNFFIGEPYLFIIADGMGGHNAGEVASSEVIEYLKNRLWNDLKDTKIPYEDTLDRIVEAISGANEDLYNKSLSKDELSGMGTTLICLVINAEENKAYIANIGDSRLYLIRDYIIKQLTQDHSLVAELLRTGNITKEEAENHPKKNLITRAVGCNNKVEVDTHVKGLQSGDIILMCTDGVTNMLNDELIKDIVLSNDDLKVCCDKMIEEVNKRGGLDNSTLIIIKV